MSLQTLLQAYPTKRIKPAPGMAVTADVWEEAHQFHHQTQGVMTLLSHGPGIISGLEVIAGDPPDTAVYILPGVAVDPAGQVIVLPQPVVYDIGQDIEGLLYLLLGYHESRPRSENGSKEEGRPLYVHAEFSISAQNALPDAPRVELARVKRSRRDARFFDARNPGDPALDEIDVRFRREVGASREVGVAVSYLGQATHKKHGRGMNYLAQALIHEGRCHVRVEDDVIIGPHMLTNSLVYLVGQGNFALDENEMKGLRNYVHRRHGTLLIECLDAAAEAVFLDFLGAKDMPPEAVGPDHPLLSQPHLFTTPPPGFPSGEAKLLAGDGVIFSTYNYGLVWQGERETGPASREEIRTAIEWGGNMMAYVLRRRWGR